MPPNVSINEFLKTGWSRVSASPTLSMTLRIAVPIIALGLSMNRDMRWLLQRQHLAAEAFNIAQALVDGRGFSDPFAEATGPTAWTPPLYPFMLSLLIRLMHGRNAVGSTIVTLNVVSLIAVAATIYHVARQFRRLLPPFLVLCLYLWWIVAFHHWYFILTSDIWLNMLFGSLLLLVIAKCHVTGQVPTVFSGLLTGVATLASPTLGLACGGFIAWAFLHLKAQRNRCVFAAALALAVIAPWVIRNAIVFHEFIPIKSNMAFEAQQASVVDDNGIYDPKSLNQHPFNDLNLRFSYAKMGEQRFVAAAGQRFWQYCHKNPGAVLRKLGNRLLAVTVVLVPAGIREPAWSLWLQRLVYPIPLIGMGLGLYLAKSQRALFSQMTVCYSLYLLPHVLIAFYLRYLFAITPILMLLAFLGFDELAARWKRVAH